MTSTKKQDFLLFLPIQIIIIYTMWFIILVFKEFSFCQQLLVKIGWVLCWPMYRAGSHLVSEVVLVKFTKTKTSRVQGVLSSYVLCFYCFLLALFLFKICPFCNKYNKFLLVLVAICFLLTQQCSAGVVLGLLLVL